jgi:four helix bundle protein
MKTENIIQTKSFQFAVRILKASQVLFHERKEYIVTKQLLRSGTSIGANVEEAIGGYSDVDFLHKLSVAYKEARETKYWIRLLRAGNFFKKEEAISLLNDITEICKILAKILLTTKNKIAKLRAKTK